MYYQEKLYIRAGLYSNQAGTLRKQSNEKVKMCFGR